MRWFNRKVSVLNRVTANIVNTVKVIASCITFSCHKLNGPPFAVKPILLAGTWKMYSKNAIPQLIKMAPSSPKLLNQPNSLNFKCPYHAKVMKVLERIKRKMVSSSLFIFYRIRVVIFHPNVRSWSNYYAYLDRHHWLRVYVLPWWSCR